MSVVTTYAIFCDKCGNWEGDCTSLKQTRREVNRLGWKRVRDDGRLKDLCPKCAAEAAAKGGGDA